MSLAEVMRDLQHSSPLLLIVGMGLVLMILDAFAGHGRKDYLGWISLLGIAVAMGLVGSAWGDAGKPVARHLFEGMLVHDNYSLFANLLFLSCAAITVLLSMSYLREHEMEHGEYYVLLLFAVAGMMVLAAASDLVTLFLGLETMSISVYVLVGFRRHSDRSAEGAMKYFLLGAFSTAILLYGVALIYGATGHTNLQEIAKKIAAVPKLLDDPYLLVGVVLLLVALGFKVATVPFHMWTPDVYEGAPTSVTGFMACAVKAAGFVALVRVFTTAFGTQKGLTVGPHGWFTIVLVVCVLTMVVGNLVAIAQKSVKRMLAYSSIGHAGYLLLGLLASAHLGQGPVSSVLFYLFAYSFTVLGAFGVVLVLERRGRDEPLRLDDLAGLGYRHPWAGLAMTIFLLSLAGLPPTAGFFAKFYLFRAAIQAGAHEAAMYTLVVLAVLTSTAAAFYYLRVVVYMYFREPEGETALLRSPAAAVALVLAAVLVMAIGILPDPYLALGEKAVASLGMFGKL